MGQTVKYIKETDDAYTIGGYGVVWGGRDLVGTYFTENTDFWLDRITATPPVLYHHGFDQTTKKAVLGQVTSIKADKTGLWVEAQLEKSRQYVKDVMELINKGVLGYSTGSVSHLAEETKSGHILSWPIVEVSLTPEPAEPRCLGVAELDNEDAEPAVKSMLDAIKATWSTSYVNKLKDSCFLYIEAGQEKDAEGKTVPRSARHFPYKDADGAIDLPHLRNAIARIPQSTAPGLDDAKKKRLQNKARKLLDGANESKDTDATKMRGSGAPDGSYERLIEQLSMMARGTMLMGGEPDCYGWVVATFADHFIYRHEGGEYYRVEYTRSEDGKPVLGGWTEVETEYVPVNESEMDSEATPVALSAARFAQFAAALGERTKDLAQRRIAEGRSLSAGNVSMIANAKTAALEALTELDALVADDSEPGTKDLDSDGLRTRIAIQAERIRMLAS